MAESNIDIEYLVSKALLIDDHLGRAIIEIQGAEGIITLKGTIESEQDRLAVEALARAQQGVLEVVNRLRVPAF